MDWSATLSLTTSQARQHRANYGSFGSSTSSAPLKRNGSGSTISIPESIPEHQCVVQFESPRLKHAQVQVLEHYDVFGISSSSSSTVSQTLTITEKASTLQTFKLLLTSPSSSSSKKNNGGSAATVHVANSCHDLGHGSSSSSTTGASSYWLQERERMRLQRERRHLTRNGSPTKAATLRDDDDPETSHYRTAVIMCSVPLLLVTFFLIFVLAFGDGVVAADAAVVLSASSPTLSPPTMHLRSVVAPSPAARAAENSHS